MRVESVSGASGGTFALRDEGETDPRFVLRANESTGDTLFSLSENDGSKGSDPYGHIHGRTFIAEAPGLYTVGFRIVDLSTNGIAGNPLHAPSEIFPMYFQAGLGIHSITIDANASDVRVWFGGQPNAAYILESSSSLGDSAAWTKVDGPVTAGNKLLNLTDLAPGGTTRFYRVRFFP